MSKGYETTLPASTKILLTLPERSLLIRPDFKFNRAAALTEWRYLRAT